MCNINILKKQNDNIYIAKHYLYNNKILKKIQHLYQKILFYIIIYKTRNIVLYNYLI